MAAIAATMSASVTMVRPELSGEAQNSIIYDILSEVFEVTEGLSPKLPIFRPGGQREQALRSDIGLWVIVAEEYGIRAATVGYFTARSISWQLEWDYNYMKAEWTRFLFWLLRPYYPPYKRFEEASDFVMGMARALADLGLDLRMEGVAPWGSAFKTQKRYDITILARPV